MKSDRSQRLKNLSELRKRVISTAQSEEASLLVEEPGTRYSGDVNHAFGGTWTDQKLERLRKYLSAYTTALKNQPFELAYIDAFAGTGYRTAKANEDTTESIFPELEEEDARQFVEGSARIALQTEPHFANYIFIEKKGKHISELERLKMEFPDKANDIAIENAEANDYLKKLCIKNWKKHRAVLFLDPYGMQVRWDTLAMIAQTKAIDIWILFPLGVAVNRLLKRNGKINDVVRKRLDEMFGTGDWYNAFYKEITSEDLFGSRTTVRKVSSFPLISKYFVERLRTIFAGVAPHPLPLYNSRGNPLYLLCFSAANPTGARIALKIAQNILQG